MQQHIFDKITPKRARNAIIAAMNEIDRNIGELYQSHSIARAVVEQIEQERKTLVGRLTRALNRRISERDREAKVKSTLLSLGLEKAVRERLGLYPVNGLIYGPGLVRDGFMYGFDYQVGDTTVSPEYFADGSWGIKVQREPEDYVPSVEIRGTDDDGEELSGLTLLHLPEGVSIPVGPVHFTEEDTPLSEEQTREMLKRFIPHPVKHKDRYFYWQPVLPDGRGRITIDFHSINPEETGTSWEEAPIINKTIIPDLMA